MIVTLHEILRIEIDTQIARGGQKCILKVNSYDFSSKIVCKHVILKGINDFQKT